MDRKQKVEFLKGYEAGERSIAEITGYKVTLYDTDRSDNNYLIEIGNPNNRISRADYEHSLGIKVTLNLNQ